MVVVFKEYFLFGNFESPQRPNPSRVVDRVLRATTAKECETAERLIFSVPHLKRLPGGRNLRLYWADPISIYTDTSDGTGLREERPKSPEAVQIRSEVT